MKSLLRLMSILVLLCTIESVYKVNVAADSYNWVLLAGTGGALFVFLMERDQ